MGVLSVTKHANHPYVESYIRQSSLYFVMGSWDAILADHPSRWMNMLLSVCLSWYLSVACYISLWGCSVMIIRICVLPILNIAQYDRSCLVQSVGWNYYFQTSVVSPLVWEWINNIPPFPVTTKITGLQTLTHVRPVNLLCIIMFKIRKIKPNLSSVRQKPNVFAVTVFKMDVITYPCQVSKRGPWWY